MQPDLAHVRDVEQTRLRPGVEVLGDDPGRVLHRHLIAGERHHPGATGEVELVKRCVPQGRCRCWIGQGRTSGDSDAVGVREMPPLS